MVNVTSVSAQVTSVLVMLLAYTALDFKLKQIGDTLKIIVKCDKEARSELVFLVLLKCK